jgi:hypothetical protein
VLAAAVEQLPEHDHLVALVRWRATGEDVVEAPPRARSIRGRVGQCMGRTLGAMRPL